MESPGVPAEVEAADMEQGNQIEQAEVAGKDAVRLEREVMEEVRELGPLSFVVGAGEDDGGLGGGEMDPVERVSEGFGGQLLGILRREGAHVEQGAVRHLGKSEPSCHRLAKGGWNFDAVFGFAAGDAGGPQKLAVLFGDGFAAAGKGKGVGEEEAFFEGELGAAAEAQGGA
jgi:hypothetical protein